MFIFFKALDLPPSALSLGDLEECDVLLPPPAECLYTLPRRPQQHQQHQQQRSVKEVLDS